tara:strand:+ start:445 stop:705 length:261 start_codon:yes stop_codon:yes gene_type:complete
MKGTPFKLKQKLSKEAALKKAASDLAMAKTPYRRAAKADAQKKHRASPVNKNKDYDHKSGTFKSVKANRGNDGEGTKKEGKRNYKI